MTSDASTQLLCYRDNSEPDCTY